MLYLRLAGFKIQWNMYKETYLPPVLMQRHAQIEDYGAPRICWLFVRKEQWLLKYRTAQNECRNMLNELYAPLMMMKCSNYSNFSTDLLCFL